MQKSFTVKLWKVMKICAAQTLIALTLCGVSLAHSNYAQILDQQITISLSDVPFEEALKKIEQIAKVKFAFSTDQLEDEEPVSVSANDRSLRDLLEELLRPRNIRYKVHEREKMITLKKYAQQESNSQSHLDESEAEANVPLLEVTGVVTDAGTKQPMAGVNIIVKGTTRGTTSDADGNFTIEAEDGEVLVFSFIGYAPHELKLSGQTNLRIELLEDITSLKEVVVNAGYYTVTRETQTGNIAKIESADIRKQPVSNPLMAVQARMAGVVVLPATGMTGSAMRVQIRGQNSLRTDGNYPLYIIDGVPLDSRPIESINAAFFGFDPLNTLNPSNIESIEILKDADATSIYGSRGANGVILITTKKGAVGKTNVDLQVYNGVGEVAEKMKLLSGTEYLAMRNEAFTNDGLSPGSSDPDLNGTWDANTYTDWQDLLFGASSNYTDAQLAISGGTNKTSFRFGGGFRTEQTVFPGDFGYRKAMANLNIHHASQNDRFDLMVSINYGLDRNKVFRGNVVSAALTLPPIAPVFDDNGQFEWDGYNFNNMPNPLAKMRIGHKASTNNLIGNAVFSYELAKGLRIKSSFGYSDARTDEIINTPQAAMDPSNSFESTSDFNNRRSYSWIIEPQAIFEKSIGEGNLTALLGGTWQESNNDFLMVRASGFTSDELLGNIQAASTLIGSGYGQAQYRYNAVFGRLGYTWQRKYVLNLTARRDGSSRFGPNRKFANFGAAGLAWIFSNENFLKDNVLGISYGKIRTTYGTSGSDQIGDYGYLSALSTSPFPYLGVTTLYPTALANPEFAWEVNRKFEVGLDLNFLKDQLQFSGSWYRNESSNQLVGYPLPRLTGFTSVQANLGATVRNMGVEIELRTSNLKHGSFSWYSGLNLTVPRNKLVEYPNIEGSPYANSYVIGQPLSIAKTYHFTDVNPETGFYQFTDENSDMTFNSLDRQTVINFSRNLYGGISNTLRIKGFVLNFLVEYVNQTGRSYLNFFLETPGELSNQPQQVLAEKRWLNQNDNAEVQKFTTSSSAYNLVRLSDRNQVDASFIRLKNIYLAYEFPAAIASKAKLEDATIYIQGQNILTASKYIGLDPEAPGASNLPQLRMYSVGITLKF